VSAVRVGRTQPSGARERVSFDGVPAHRRDERDERFATDHRSTPSGGSGISPDTGHPAAANGTIARSTRTAADSRFRLPRLPSPWILRDGLDEKLSAAIGHRLTLVTGLPGAGKTVMLSGWAVRHSERRIAYVPLEAADNEPRVFWRTLAAALRRLQHDPQHEPRVMGVSSVLDIARRVPPLVLILDDFHLIKHPEVLADVQTLIRNIPDHVPMVISSRQDPAIPLHRLRLGGELADIRQEDLRFDFPEAESFLSAVSGGRKVSFDVVCTLLERTEGWAAGLQVAALLLRNESDPEAFARRFAGDTQVIAGYLSQEVLQDLPDVLNRFLMQTSVLEEMTPSLCAWVTGSPNAADLLDDLVSRHLFVFPIDAEHQWYRYHRLFSQLLRHLFARRDPVGMRNAHLRAAQWYESQGTVETAIEHYIQAEDFDRAFGLAANSVVERLECGDINESRTTDIADLPAGYLQRDAVRVFGLVASLLVRARHLDGEVWLHRLTRSWAGVTPTWLQSREELLWALRCWLAADAPGVLRHTTQMAAHPLERIPANVVREHRWLGRLDEMYESTMSLLAARAHLWLGDHEAVRARLQDLSLAPESLKTVVAPGMLALAAAREGRLTESHQLATGALDMARRLGVVAGVASQAANVALGVTLLERDELEQAEQHILTACELCRDLERDGWLAGCELDLVYVYMDQGRSDEAFSVIAGLRALEAAGELPAHLRRTLQLTEIGWRLRAGDLDGALGLIEQLPPVARPALLEARADLLAGRPDKASAALEKLRESHSSWNLRLELERLVLLSHARLQMGSARQARDVLRRALDIARAHRHYRVFIDEGDDVRWLLESLESRFPDPYLSDLIGHWRRRNGVAVQEPGALIEVLTERERATLSRLPSHLTQQQIAADMYVSLNTLKTHVKSLYRKLGATTRSEAVAAARSRGLI
jgi:LuxR family transcriptional regulator, maltose regulon positive regulatory protein